MRWLPELVGRRRIRQHPRSPQEGPALEVTHQAGQVADLPRLTAERRIPRSAAPLGPRGDRSPKFHPVLHVGWS
ncbi:hypothetical protein FRAHR75_540035 [Frankia sp. Hr75.2]|nr:hypothetical protein FRAHR75_540035 [Frankia sp. Hr75.2]